MHRDPDQSARQEPSATAPWLLTVAATAEAEAVLQGLGVDAPLPAEWHPFEASDRLVVVVTGIGKSNAAAATAGALGSRTFGAVLNLGIAGSLPVATPLALGDTVIATRSIYADEGLVLPDGSFIGCSDMGFPLGPFDDWGVRGDPSLLDKLAGLATVTAPIATVSTCSATDPLARTVVERTWAVAEAMEGAAVGHVAARLGVPFLELRAVSNTTGDRGNQRWSIRLALDRVRELAAGVAAAAAR
ncbi:MAG: futalosine hydrolase [Phycisphaerales bacterium]|nr:futalosine hydrolase [Phycisphaerales bacterium]